MRRMIRKETDDINLRTECHNVKSLVHDFDFLVLSFFTCIMLLIITFYVITVIIGVNVIYIGK